MEWVKYGVHAILNLGVKLRQDAARSPISAAVLSIAMRNFLSMVFVTTDCRED